MCQLELHYIMYWMEIVIFSNSFIKVTDIGRQSYIHSWHLLTPNRFFSSPGQLFKRPRPVLRVPIFFCITIKQERKGYPSPASAASPLSFFSAISELFLPCLFAYPTIIKWSPDHPAQKSGFEFVWCYLFWYTPVCNGHQSPVSGLCASEHKVRPH